MLHALCSSAGRRFSATVFAVLLFGTSGNALEIQLDLGNDAATQNFFQANPLAQTALQAAAADVSHLLTSNLQATGPSYAFSSTSGKATVSVSWAFSSIDPISGSKASLPSFSLSGQIVPVLVEMRSLSAGVWGAATATLVDATPTAILRSGVTDQDTVTAGNQTVASSNGMMLRGGGPALVTHVFTVAQHSFSVASGDFGGRMVLSESLPATGAGAWHFDPATAPAANEVDFYTVALREILTTLGFGYGYAWASDISGTNWLGPAVLQLLGSGAGVIASDQQMAAGLAAMRLSDGSAQDAVMAPGFGPGIRRTLTDLDAAFLRDLNYTTIPEPGSALLALLGLGSLATRRRLGR